MDEAQIMEVALDSVADLKGVREDVASILSLLRKDASEVPSSEPAQVEVVNVADLAPLSEDSENWTTQVTTNAVVPDTFFDDLMRFQYMQVSTSVLILFALLLNVGVMLWLSFSRHWKS